MAYKMRILDKTYAFQFSYTDGDTIFNREYISGS